MNLGLEIQHSLTGIEISRNRNVIVHDEPLAVDLAQATSGTNPQVGLLTALQFPAHSFQRVQKGHITAGNDAHVTILDLNRATSLCQEFLISFSFPVPPHTL